MVVAAPSPRNLRFGPYLADLSTGELWRDGVKVSLQDKPFQILALLLQHPGELVTREELRVRLWPADTFVDFEHGLNTAVKKLRQALDDSAEEPRFVETLPRRGYRFLVPVAGEVPAAETVRVDALVPFEGAAAPTRARSSGPRWPLHAAWLGVALLAAAVAWRVRGSDRLVAPPAANRVPVLVLMDSPLPGRVYDPRTLAAGGTNADDLTDALRDLPVVIEKENTSPMWHREQQVLQQNPDLIVSHLSCLYDQRVAPDDPVRLQFFTLAVDRLLSFFAYVAQANPRTRFLVYSRGRFEQYGGTEKFRTDAEARFPVLAGRLHPWTVPGDPEKVTFRDPPLARLIRERVQAILGPS